MKLAKLYAWRRKKDHNKGIISTVKAFHGKSIGSLSVSGKAEFREPFYPLVPGVRFVPYGDADALDKELGSATPSASTSPRSSSSRPGGGRCHHPARRLLPQGSRGLRQVGHPPHRR